MTKHYVGPARQTEAPTHREMSPGGGRKSGAAIPWWMVGTMIAVLVLVGRIVIGVAELVAR